MPVKKNGLRTESDGSEQVKLPAGAYWGARTIRATEGFNISGQHLNQRIVHAFVSICKCSILSMCEAGLVETRIAQAVSQAADEVIAGQWNDQFIVDALQPDAAKALSFNVAEVLANRAAETLGGNIGTYDLVCPRKHVFLGLAREDVFCCAVRIAVVNALAELEPALLDTERLLRRKALEFDARMFNGYASTVQRTHRRLNETSRALLELNLLRFNDAELPSTLAVRTIEKLNESSNAKFVLADECLRIGHITADFVGVSGCLRELVLVIARIASDLRNTVQVYAIADAVIAGSYQICGADASLVMCAQDSSLPVQMFANIAHSCIAAVEIGTRSVKLFNRQFLSTLSAKPAPKVASAELAVNVPSITSV